MLIPLGFVDAGQSVWQTYTIPFSSPTDIHGDSNLGWLVVGSSSTYATSADGITWTSRTGPWSSADLVTIQFLPTKKWLVLNSSNGDFWTSSNGTSWTFADGRSALAPSSGYKFGKFREGVDGQYLSQYTENTSGYTDNVAAQFRSDGSPFFVQGLSSTRGYYTSIFANETVDGASRQGYLYIPFTGNANSTLTNRSDALFLDNSGELYKKTVTLPLSTDWSVANSSIGVGVILAGAVNESNVYLTYADESTFTSRTFPVAAKWKDITGKNTRYVAVGVKDSSSTSVISTNYPPTNWIESTLPISEVVAVSDIGNIFVAIDKNTNLIARVDATTI